MAAQAGLSRTLSKTPKTGFLMTRLKVFTIKGSLTTVAQKHKEQSADKTKTPAVRSGCHM